jgi:hypothetical protein
VETPRFSSPGFSLFLEQPVDTNEETRADFRQAKSFMQAGINSSLAGDDTDALVLFNAAQQRFKKLHMTLDAGIAGAWIRSLMQHAQLG